MPQRDEAHAELEKKKWAGDEVATHPLTKFAQVWDKEPKVEFECTNTECPTYGRIVEINGLRTVDPACATCGHGMTPVDSDRN